MPRAAIVRGLSVLVVSTLVLLAIQIGLNAAALRNDFPFELRFWSALPMILPLAIPLAMLPIMMLVRGTGRVTTRGAATLVATGVILTYLTAGWVTPLMRADVRDELYEELDRRVVAERSGRPRVLSRDGCSPGEADHSRRTCRRTRTLAEQSAYLEAQARQTRPRWGRGTILTAALALAMGVLGWGIGALRPDGAHSGRQRGGRSRGSR